MSDTDIYDGDLDARFERLYEYIPEDIIHREMKNALIDGTDLDDLVYWLEKEYDIPSYYEGE